MTLSDQQAIHALSRMPFVDSTELAGILGHPHTTVHRHLADLLAQGIVNRVSHGTVHLPSSRRYYLTHHGVSEAARLLGFKTVSGFLRTFPMSRERLTWLIRRLDAVASVYRLAATMSGVTQGKGAHVEFHPWGGVDASITLADGRLFGVVRQGPALRRRTFYDRLRTMADLDSASQPNTVLVLTPSEWELRRSIVFCREQGLYQCFVAVESREALEERRRRLWWRPGGEAYTLESVARSGSPGGVRHTELADGKRASLRCPERMVEVAPVFGISPSEKRTLDLITDHPMIPREHLAGWLGVTEGRVSQMIHSLVKDWRLVERRGKRGATRYTLSGEGIRYIAHRDHAEGMAISAGRRGRKRRTGNPIETWARQRKHADGITWFLSKVESESRDRRGCELLWSTPTAKADRAHNWSGWPIAPDAVGRMVAGGLDLPFFLEYELTARNPRDVEVLLATYRSVTIRRKPWVKTLNRCRPPCSSWTPGRSRPPT